MGTTNPISTGIKHKHEQIQARTPTTALESKLELFVVSTNRLLARAKISTVKRRIINKKEHVAIVRLLANYSFPARR